MAVRIGTAADHVELWEELLDFLTADADLVAAGQNWTVEWQSPTDPDTELVLKGPGLSGDNEIFIGLKRTDNTLTAGESLIWMSGMTGVNASGTTYRDHVNTCPLAASCFLDQGPMGYWFVANGRRFVVVIKISTVYQALYGGFFLPYASPISYPYPVFIGGTRAEKTSSVSDITVNTWRASGRDSYGNFPYPWLSASGASTHSSQSLLIDPSGVWREGTGSDTQNTGYQSEIFRVGPRAWPRYMGEHGPDHMQGPTSSSPLYVTNPFGYEDFRRRVAPGLNGEVALTPVTLYTSQNNPGPQPTMYGILDGVHYVGGLNNAVENIVTIDDVDHLVVQNVMRTGLGDYWTLALE